ncbi:MAG: hypothetical protein M3N42_08860 [Cyanobacteriota bacterium]|nr:hypothetical protein [Cyanobacteriota bacterium]
MTVHGVNSQQSTVNSQLEFTIPMLTDLILGRECVPYNSILIAPVRE